MTKKNKLIKTIKREVPKEFYNQFVSDLIYELGNETNFINIRDIDVVCSDCFETLQVISVDSTGVQVDTSNCTCKKSCGGDCSCEK